MNNVDPKKTRTDIEIKLSDHIQSLFSKGIESMMDEDQLEERYNKEVEEKHTEFKKQKFVINDDIYSLAFAALINPEELDYSEMKDGEKEKYLSKELGLTRRERSGLYQSALMVVFIQITTIFLLIMFFKNQEKGINSPEGYLILIPRLLSSFMMHLQVESDIRNGLALMKYAINHPFMFSAPNYGSGGDNVKEVK